jgi:hypothetical protein
MKWHMKKPSTEPVHGVQYGFAVLKAKRNEESTQFYLVWLSFNFCTLQWAIIQNTMKITTFH